MTILYDSHGAPITSSIHEPEDWESQPARGLDPAQAWLRCTCGWDWESMESAGGPVGSMRDAWEQHLEDVGGDA